MDDDAFGDMLARETLLSREKRIALEKLVQAKQALLSTVPAQITAEYNRMRADVKAAMTGLSDSEQASFLRGFDESRPGAERLLREFVAAYTDTYQHLLALYAILDENDGKFTIRDDGMVIFPQAPPIALYNRETADLRRALTNLTNVQQKFVEAQQTGFQRIVNLGK